MHCIPFCHQKKVILYHLFPPVHWNIPWQMYQHQLYKFTQEPMKSMDSFNGKIYFSLKRYIAVKRDHCFAANKNYNFNQHNIWMFVCILRLVNFEWKLNTSIWLQIWSLNWNSMKSHDFHSTSKIQSPVLR